MASDAGDAMLSVTPAQALIDVPRRIAAQGLAPGETVTLTARTVRGPGVAWRSQVRVQAGADGTVDLQRDAPLSGACDHSRPMGETPS